MAGNYFGRIGLVAVGAALLGGCANGGFDLSTGSISPQQAAAKPDPVCASLTSQINALKADGTIERLEQAADGKTTKVSVKRTALQKQTELNKAYAQYQARCGQGATTQSAQATPPAQPAATTTAN